MDQRGAGDRGLADRPRRQSSVREGQATPVIVDTAARYPTR
jgi:hypothetical protein